MVYLLIYFVCAVSPLLAVAEPLALLCSLDPELNWIGVAMMVTLGQVTGFAFLYTFGGQVIQRVQWLSNRLEALDLSRYQNAKWKITASAAVLGLPPVTLLSLAGRGYETRRNFYLLIVLAGRFLRFLVIAGAPALFVTYFGPWLLPAWVHDLFPGVPYP